MPDIVIPKINENAYNEFLAELSRELEDLTLDEVKSSIQRVNAVASGDLLKSITAQVSRTSITNFVIDVGSDDPAAIAVEEGFQGDVSINTIFLWMLDKKLRASKVAAFRIAKKIKEVGYVGRHPFQIAEEKIASKIEGLIGEVLNRKGIL